MSEKPAGKPKSTGKKGGSSSKSKKEGGSSYLVRQSKAKKVVTEEELRKKDVITPEDVLALTEATKGYLCPKAANIFGIEFVRFKVRDMDSQQVLFEIAKPEDAEEGEVEDNGGEVEGKEGAEGEEDTERFIRYEFPPQVLRLKTLGATIEFVVGAKEVRNFTMVERHFFRDVCLKDFDITFPYCMPNSRNTCEYIYDVPELSPQQKHDIIAAPFETKSDSFYFVEGKLVMHNKAEYAYNAGV